MVSNTAYAALVEEARARGLKFAMNDLRSAASHIRGRMEEDGVRWDSLQSWASMEVVVDALEALEAAETANVSRETFVPSLAASIEVNWETQRLTIENRPLPWHVAEVGPRVEALGSRDELGLVWLPVLAEAVTVIGSPPADVSRETSASPRQGLDPYALSFGLDVVAHPLRDGSPVEGVFLSVDSNGSELLVLLDVEGERQDFSNSTHYFTLKG